MPATNPMRTVPANDVGLPLAIRNMPQNAAQEIIMRTKTKLKSHGVTKYPHLKSIASLESRRVKHNSRILASLTKMARIPRIHLLELVLEAVVA